MLLYNVTYPHGRSMDFDVSWVYLERIAKDPKHDDARATCTNGQLEKFVLKNGTWILIEGRRRGRGGR